MATGYFRALGLLWQSGKFLPFPQEQADSSVYVRKIRDCWTLLRNGRLEQIPSPQTGASF